MKLEDLCVMSASQLEALTDKELEEICKPYFTTTRPELVVKQEKSEPVVYRSPNQQKALELLAQEGIDVSFMKRKKK